MEHIGSFDPEITCRNSSVSKDFFKTLHIERGQQLDKTYITPTQWTDFYIKATLGGNELMVFPKISSFLANGPFWIQK